MYKNPANKQFWRVWSPLLIYWGISFLSQVLIAMVLFVVVWLPDMASKVENGHMSLEALDGEVLPQMIVEVTAFVAKYTVHILTITAVFTLCYTVTAFYRDRKADRMAGIILNSRVKITKYALIAGLAAVSCLGLNFLLIMMQSAFPSLIYNQIAANTIYTAPIWLQIVGFGIIMPMSEEMLFRGLIYKRYRERNDFRMAMLSSSFLFGLVHGNLIQFIYAFSIGMLFAFVYEKFGTIKAPLFFHILVNLIVIAYTNAKGFEWLFAEPIRIAVSVVICAFLGSVLFVFIQRMDSPQEISK